MSVWIPLSSFNFDHKSHKCPCVWRGLAQYVFWWLLDQQRLEKKTKQRTENVERNSQNSGHSFETLMINVNVLFKPPGAPSCRLLWLNMIQIIFLVLNKIDVYFWPFTWESFHLGSCVVFLSHANTLSSHPWHSNSVFGENSTITWWWSVGYYQIMSDLWWWSPVEVCSSISH